MLSIPAARRASSSLRGRFISCHPRHPSSHCFQTTSPSSLLYPPSVPLARLELRPQRKRWEGAEAGDRPRRLLPCACMTLLLLHQTFTIPRQRRGSQSYSIDVVGGSSKPLLGKQERSAAERVVQVQLLVPVPVRELRERGGSDKRGMGTKTRKRKMCACRSSSSGGGGGGGGSSSSSSRKEWQGDQTGGARARRKAGGGAGSHV